MDHPAIAKVSTPEPPRWPALFRDGICSGPAHLRPLRPKTTHDQGAAGAVIKVCEGVQHAHQKAVIHRDLKPATFCGRGGWQPMLDHRLRAGETASPQLDGETLITQAGNGWAHRVYESGASRSNRDGCGYTHHVTRWARSALCAADRLSETLMTPKGETRFSISLRWVAGRDPPRPAPG